jgi:S1-C subfamily serine protease
VGLTWRWDDAEPGSVILTQVVYGSAAHAAGLLVRDRVYSISGQAFNTEAELSGLVSTLPSPLEMEVERQGKLQTIKVEVLADQPPAE